MPKWPDPIRDRMANVVPATVPEHYDLDRSGASVVEKDDSFEITWDVSISAPGSTQTLAP
jgi:hypothetical protein